LIYVLDDNLEYLVDDPLLPEDYRARVADFVSSRYVFLLEQADEILLCSQQLLTALAGRTESQAGFTQARYRYFDPYWRLQHLNQDKKIQSTTKLSDGLAFLGTRSHLADLDLLRPALEEILPCYPRLRFTTRLGKDAPDWLRQLSGALNLMPLSWSEYLPWLCQNRFAISLYPTIRSEFNHCRSVNKVMEQAVTGSACLYSQGGVIARRLPSGLEGSIVETTDDWASALKALIEDRAHREAAANRHTDFALELDKAAGLAQAEVWGELSELDELSAEIMPL